MGNYKMILKRPVISNQQEILDRASVKELVEFERFCRDNAHWDEMRKCFAEDSQVAISWYQGSGIGFVEASSKQDMRAPHKIYNTEVWLNGDKAVAIMMATIQMPHEIDGCPVELSSEAKIIYRVKKVAEQWHIDFFTCIYEKDAIIPVLPTSKLNLSSDELYKSRRSYGCLIYMLKMKGMKAAEDLPGIDRPDLVEKLYKELDNWLSE